MKTFVERYTQDEFDLIENIRRVLRITRNDRFSGNYQPYQVNSNSSLSQLGFSAKINEQEVSIDLYLRNLKLDFAIQVWEIAQDLTKNKYYDYLKHEWNKSDDPIKKLNFKSRNRENAEKYFEKMLVEICNEEKLTVSERAIFLRHEHIGYDSSDLRLEVCVDENKVTDEIVDNIHKQFWKNEKHYLFNKKNVRFKYEEIKDYFVPVDTHLLSLLNAEDGQKTITELEKELFENAEKMNLEGILKILQKGVDINSIDTDGETTLTKVIKASRYDFMIVENEEHLEKLKKEIPDFTNEEKINLAQKLLDQGADLDFFGYDGLNSLQYTSYAHNPVLMKFLLDNGANPNINYFPDDGENIISIPLDNILFDYNIHDDEKQLDECRNLLIKAGAKT